MKLLLPLLAIPLAGARVIQIPITTEAETETPSTTAVLAGEDEVAPGVGVHFTTSYAVAAARYQNGTIRDMGKIEGDAEYIELMSRWMRSYSAPSWEDDCQRMLSSPSNKFESNRFKCNIKYANRKIRKLLGRPTSRDAATLSKFLHKTRSTIEAELGEPLTSIAPTIFNIRPEQEQDMGDALDFIGLRSSRERSRAMYSDLNTAYVDSEANAAFAGLHMDLRPNTHQDIPHPSTRKSPTRSILYINFDNSSLTASAHQFTSPDQTVMYNHIASADLGWWSLPVFEVPRAKFWAQVHEAIASVAGNMWKPPGRIVLMGEHGADQEFREVVQAALDSVLELDVRGMLQVNKAGDSLSLAARGAAEMAWREREEEELRRGGRGVLGKESMEL